MKHLRCTRLKDRATISCTHSSGINYNNVTKNYEAYQMIGIVTEKFKNYRDEVDNEYNIGLTLLPE